MEKETIAAISTGMTNSGIGIVRISGPEALGVAERVYKGRDNIKDADSHTIHYGHITDGQETSTKRLSWSCARPGHLPERIRWRSTAMAACMC